ncbi:MAG TPA: peptidase T [Proteiniclasticum sp.]|jgi:tripeptide aminopeptidase|uniref:peptidase T n=1 Tax=Proteiniclasticum sp. TaxID=2053595 RepID=UPI000E9F2953|nr:peptidase T [Proteiniclasticum sp.]HBW13024.1 peptidase T [Proteiniclasticum sp.]
MSVVDKLIKYVKYETTSDENSVTVPSTEGQRVLVEELKRELEALGLETALDENGYLFGFLRNNTGKNLKKLGLLAHVDTSPDMSGKNVNPRILPYEGGDIVLNEELQIVMKESDFPQLKEYVGENLLVTDGTTLLGADDKAGVAEIMEVLEYLFHNPEVPHGDLHVAFTPDEEIGRGPHHFDVEAFGAEIAYTMDGGPVGELEYENFNAASAKVTVKGRNVHPGTAKDKMKNSIFVAMEYADAFDRKDTPEHTEGYEGFFHLNDIEGDVEETSMYYIIRDFFEDTFEGRKVKMMEAASVLNEKYGEGTVTVEIKDQYKNMRTMVEPHMYLIEHAKKAMEMAGVKPIIKPIRGGTDGAQLSYMGLPCPNLFTGGENYHGRFEFISVESMEKAVAVLKNLISIYAEEV